MGHRRHLAAAIEKTLQRGDKPDLSEKDWKIVIGSLLNNQDKARWIHWTDDRKDYVKCSECDYGEEGEVLLGQETPYCPYCGFEMEN